MKPAPEFDEAAAIEEVRDYFKRMYKELPIETYKYEDYEEYEETNITFSKKQLESSVNTGLKNGKTAN